MLHYELKLLVEWLCANKLSLNEKKTELIVFHPLRKPVSKPISIKLNKYKLTRTTCVKYLGIYIDETLSWNTHINNLTTKLSRTNCIIAKLRHFAPTAYCISVYKSSQRWEKAVLKDCSSCQDTILLGVVRTAFLVPFSSFQSRRYKYSFPWSSSFQNICPLENFRTALFIFPSKYMSLGDVKT